MEFRALFPLDEWTWVQGFRLRVWKKKTAGSLTELPILPKVQQGESGLRISQSSRRTQPVLPVGEMWSVLFSQPWLLRKWSVLLIWGRQRIFSYHVVGGHTAATRALNTFICSGSGISKFSLKGQSKCFQLCNPWDLFSKYSALPLKLQVTIDYSQASGSS